MLYRFFTVEFLRTVDDITEDASAENGCGARCVEIVDATDELEFASVELPEYSAKARHLGSAERVDESVARAKLGWWAEELERMARDEARHPVTRALAAPLGRRGIDAARYNQIAASIF